MLLSKSCEYGLRASLYLATLERDEEYVSIGEISDALDISFHFLTKTFQKLTEAGIMHSHRGPKGGIALAKPADEVLLLDIVLAIDGDELFEECILGLPGCGNQRPCPIHEQWATERARLKSMFTRKSLEETAREVREHKLRLKDLMSLASKPE